MINIKNNIQLLREKIIFFEKKYARPSRSVFLLAVSKKQSVEKILQAIEANQFAFGENYLQEALTKIHFFKKNYPHIPIEWHFIGKIQQNKTRKIAEHFSWVHSVDQEKIAQRLNDQRPEGLPPLNICLEVNLNHESTKSGVDISEVESFIDFCVNLPNLRCRGLMALPAQIQDFEKQRAIFHPLEPLVKKFKSKINTFDTLSIGTSQDWEAAIAEGATIIRIGTSIFDDRKI